MSSAYPLTEVNILPKFNENFSKGSGDMERTQKCHRQMDGQMDRRTDRLTKGIPIISLLLGVWGLI